ncbi:MAG: YraN family protein [Actinobacteria bacterium HGW-Actinobacteria-9]|jgi:putative endonuclease|nr:MAG: YraN family protein [Actinobacteria bacterium HGW-Actinobacteria-9]
MSDIELGTRGEDAAAAFLERLGMTIMERNWRCKAGEIDIVGLDGETLVLVEVKTRRTAARGTPEEAVSPTKQKKLIRLAREYVAHASLEPQEIRFDVIGIVPISQDRALLRHHRAAFGA